MTITISKDKTEESLFKEDSLGFLFVCPQPRKNGARFACVANDKLQQRRPPWR